ncbi:MAG: 6,7-dimethyl-8-ribityllumazine synthase [Gammaproteobacteria bacterium]|nr:6,7-dimethyl-8-ribityllumazine synthase [Gammaproteobacteria bacterium]NDF86011.1 6,7-dimethyl-8-ribityllumazine synthase [Gammaproteobacteria bacterium]
MKIGSSGNTLSATAALDARGLKIAIACSRFNDLIVAQLLAGARAAWARHGGADADLIEFLVPGAFELPLACQQLALTSRYSAVVALGCVIRGDTPHFDYVAGECARGLMNVGLATSLPVIFGVLTVDTPAQAEERADPARMNKGGEALEAALEMARLLHRVRA